MSVVLRARRVAELVALRLSLPARLSREPMDALLASLTPTLGASSSTSARRLDVLARDMVRVERGVARLPWVPSTCLYRAMARYALLRRAGADAAFIMGLGTGGVGDPGHAWIELDGKPFAEPSDVTRYTVTFRYPPAATDANVGAP